MRGRTLLGAALAAAVLLGGPLGGPSAADRDTAASAFAVRTVRLLVGNHYGAAWTSLHPAHRHAVGSRTTYVACELASPLPAASSVDGVRVRDRRAPIAGVGRVPVKAVTLRIVFDGTLEAEPVTHIVHVLSVGRKWRWVLPNARYESYRRGECA